MKLSSIFRDSARQSCKVVTLPVWLVIEGYGPSIDSSLLITVVLE